MGRWSPVLVGLGSVLLGVPLAVLGPATGPYDDPKAWALPILVGLTAIVWLIERRGGGGDPGPAGDRPSRWLDWVVGAYAAWWVITTAASLAPGQSLLGNFGRGLGLLTFGAAMLLFPLVRAACRSAQTVRALIDVALVGSAPVCALAIGQALGWDPLPTAWDPAVSGLTVRSTFGQHIFLGSYLVTLMPLAVARLEWAIRERAADAGPGSEASRRRGFLALTASWTAGAVGLVALASSWDAAWWLLVPWGVAGAVMWGTLATVPGSPLVLPASVVGTLLVGQVLVVILSQARGAFFGMLAGLAVAASAALLRRRAWKTLGSVAAALVVVVILVVLLNVPGSPVTALRTVPLLSRLSSIGDVSARTPGGFRLEVWQGALVGWRRQLGGEMLLPGLPPRVRSFLGYGLETQIIALDRLNVPWAPYRRARGEDWQAQYLVDRAHNIVLDHLVTGGLIGVGLWALLVGLLVVTGIRRARAAGPGEFAVRSGALGAVAAHLVEAQVGIVTPMPLALFWLAAALCAIPSWEEGREGLPAPRPRRRWWTMAVVTMALATALVAWIETRWLLASVAYAQGTRSGMAGRTAEAYQAFQRSRALAPWLALPAEAEAYAALRLAGAEPDGPRRLALLHGADTALVDVERHAGARAGYWALRARVAFAQARAGERARLESSLAAFDRAAQLRSGDAQLLSEWAWALLEARDPARARAIAEQALAEARRGEPWLAWAVLSRAARELGDDAQAGPAATRARNLAPPQAQRILESLGLPPG